MKSIPEAKIKEIAFEIASLGRLGIDPNKSETHRLSTIPDKVFTGYKLLAYMYVAWALHKPEMVMGLGLPYHKEYEAAKKLIT